MSATLIEFVLICVIVCHAQPHESQSNEQRVAQECQGRQLHLTCPQGAVIQLQSIRLADSRCFGFGNCCPRSNDCSEAPSAEHQQTVQHHCDGQNSCSVMTEKRKIDCGYLGIDINNDYERIIYLCIDTATNTTVTVMPTTCDVTVTSRVDFGATVNRSTPDSEAVAGASLSRTPTFIITVVVMLLLIIAAVTVLACCVVRRRRRRAADIDGLMNATYCHLQAAAADQQDVVTSSEPVYELEVVTSPELLTATVKNGSPDDVTSPIYSNVINEHLHHHHHHDQQQQQSDLEHVYGEAAPCDEAAYQAVLPVDTAADDEYMNVSTNHV